MVTLSHRSARLALSFGLALGIVACSTLPEAPSDRPSYGRLASGVPVVAGEGQYVLMSFWATWCAPCRAEVPLLEAVARRYAGEALMVVAVNYKEGRAVVRSFVRNNPGLTMNVAYDPGNALSTAHAITGLPTVMLIAPDGTVVLREQGYDLEAFGTLLAHVEQVVARGGE